ncbi:hypothetical protein [Methylocaldum szegediense]|uniref:Uncharacterized protein n=1 Tax=Methylocaldum szegediense TaxID=73780 RepID=A0ABM9HZU0_9GAMM|nr:hypothetical protein [Methylocaldum szegediense]CAI8796538.1 conserved protein of unknown function [Methylocaldum szegediense]
MNHTNEHENTVEGATATVTPTAYLEHDATATTGDDKRAPATVRQARKGARKTAKGEIRSVSPLDLPSDVFEAGLERRKQNRAAILNWIREALVEGTDYGRIHIFNREKCAFAKRGEAERCPINSHWSKPSLFKPGAEKICGMLGVTVHYPNLTAYEQAALSGQPLDTIILRCELRDSHERTVAEGIGARSVQQDSGDLNKALKMAGKSAHIDATLRMAGLSEVFTQDLEDMQLGPTSKLQSPTPSVESNRAQSEELGSEPAPSPETSSRGYRFSSVSLTQIKQLEARIEELGLDRERVLRWIKAASKNKLSAFEDLTPEVYDRLVKKLAEWAKPSASERR